MTSSSFAHPVLLDGDNPLSLRVGDTSLRCSAAFLVVGAAVALVMFPPRSRPITALASLVVAMALTVHGSGARWLISAYVALSGFAFILAPILSHHSAESMAPMWAIVAIWFSGWSAGQYFADLRSAQRERASWPSWEWSGDRWILPSVLVGIASLSVQGFLLHQSAIGYAAQIHGLTSTGPLAFVALVGPVAISTAYWLPRLVGSISRQGRVLTVILVLLQALALAATGFRGAGPLFLLTVWLVGKRWEPGWRLNIRRAVGLSIGVLAIVTLFSIGSSTRATVADAVGTASAGTRVGSLENLPSVVIKRFDFLPSIEPALDLSSTGPAKAAVSPETEIVAFVPRLLWPGKPVIDYGEQVGQAFFNIPVGYRTSSSITWVGDLFVQGGPAAVLLTAVGLGFTLKRRLRPRTKPDTVRLAGSFIVVNILMTLDSPLLISAAAGLRAFIVFVVGCWLTSLAIRVFRQQRGDHFAVASGL